MPTWFRYTLFALGAALLLLAGVGMWLWVTFDAERTQRAAVEWMHSQHGRELSFRTPVALQLWPQSLRVFRRELARVWLQFRHDQAQCTCSPFAPRPVPGLA